MGIHEKLIGKPLDTTEEEHRSHSSMGISKDMMRRWNFCGDGHIPDSSIRVSLRHIKGIPPNYHPHVQTHTHDVDKLYILLSAETEDLEARIFLDNEEYYVQSPATVFVPRNLPHSYVPVKGKGTLLMIMALPCDQDYNDHTS